jgi:putative transposase
MKTVYSTNTKLKYIFGILDTEIIKLIPASTRSYWKHKLDPARIFGVDHKFDDKEVKDIAAFAKRLKKHTLSRAMFQIEKAVTNIFQDLNTKSKSTLKQYKEEIVNLVDNVKDTIGFERTLKLFDITANRYYSWKNNLNCTTSPFSRCRKLYYNQLSIDEVDVIKEYLSNREYQFWYLCSVYWKMMHDGAAFMCKATFYKYAKALGFTESRKRIKKIKYHKGIRAEKPLQLLHMDLTQFRARDGSRIFISFIVDNYSRAILGWKASLNKTSEFVVSNLQEVITNYKIMELNNLVDLMVDDGSENKGAVDDLLKQPKINMKKIIAMIDIMFSNSMVESIIKKMKYQHLFTIPIIDFEHLLAFLPKAVEAYNNRNHDKLFGCTPLEVLNGTIPNPYLFADELKLASQSRILSNIGLNCNSCLTTR